MTSQLINERIDLKGRDLVDASRVIVMKRELSEVMEKDFQQRMDINREQSTQISNQLLARFINSFQVPVLENVESCKETLLRDKFAEYGRFYQYYLQNAKGQSKCTTPLEKTRSPIV